MSKSISLGNKKKVFKSIRLAADQSGIKYITLYMRIRAGMTLAQAMKQPVRKYTKENA
jgi:hypothetical protein